MGEGAFRKAYRGSLRDWRRGRPALLEGAHLLLRLLPQAPAWLEGLERGSNLILPLAEEERVWALLHLYTPFPQRAKAQKLGSLVKGLAPLLRAVYLREAAERRGLWLSLINTLLGTQQRSTPEPSEKTDLPSWLELHLRDTLEEATRLLEAEGARLVQLEGPVRTLVQAGWGAGLPVELALQHGLGESLKSGQQIGIPRYDLYPKACPALVEAGLRSLFALPIPRQSHALLFFSTQPNWLPDAQTQALLRDMAAAIGVVQTEWTLRQELARAALTDPLTGLGNRRAFEHDLKRIQESPDRRLTMLVLFDLDSFKQINDTYGHVQADHVLARLGGVLRSKARAGDRAYRLGGDEFALLIEGPGHLKPLRVAERYRALIEEIRVAENTYLRVSLGYAIYPQDAADPESLWQLADDRMYKDKLQRKSRAPGPPPHALAQYQTPLVRLARRLGARLGLGPEEMNALQAGCYLLQLATGELRPNPEMTLPNGLLREAARMLLYLHSPWEGKAGRGSEPIPWAARVLQAAHGFIQALRSMKDPKEALEALRKDPRFDPGVVKAFPPPEELGELLSQG
ncbi:diguanylate cyclase [Meiothermus sp. QL-1]|uniref:diguanylate cyclase n=1 Tax=Meiothermus sp. QL-1 TaxID=2058095 RepID=UPI0011C06F28|nr:diguanylate cyclase [Meiothermus sp. QL-1]